MAVNLSPIWGAGAQLLDNSGNVLSGGKIYTYAAGTTTPAVTYTSSNGLTANSNPIILNSAGRVPYEIWLTDGISYKFVLKDSNDVLIATYDNLTGINSNFIAYTAQQEIQTATAGQTVFTLTTMQYQPATNNLSVFVDGVNQYGPGAQYAYVETDATTVTFVSGLHVGASVKFTTASPVASAVTNAADVAYDPPFTGAVGTNVEDKLAQTVNVKDFGAVGDGITDDTVAIQSALDYCNTWDREEQKPFLMGSPGTYKVSSTLTISCDCDLSSMKIIANANLVSPVIRVGGTIATEITWRKNVTLPQVENDSRTVNQWGAGIGVQLTNCNTCIITAPQIQFFETGLSCGGLDQGFAYNTVYLQYIYNNKINVDVSTNDASGWANQNLFMGGRLGYTTSYFSSVTNSGSRNIVLGNASSSANNNIFINTSVEGVTFPEYSIEFRQKTAYNQLQNCRYEGAAAQKVLFNTDSASGNNSNLIIGGYQAPSITYTFSGVGTSDYNSAFNGRSNSIEASGVGFNIKTYSGDQPHLQGFSPLISALDKGNAATNWSYRLYEYAFSGKKSTDTHARVAMGWQGSGGTLQLGDGTIDPYYIYGDSTSCKFYGWSSVAPYTDNVTSLGLSGYRWTTVYATTGTINTSDKNQKQNIEELDDAEKRVALAIKKLIKKFKFKDAVENKNNNARIHIGVIAQEVKTAFDDENLDAEKYGLFCSDTLEDGTEQLGIRYEELLAFIIAAL